LFEIDKSHVVMHEADEPNTVVDFLEAEAQPDSAGSRTDLSGSPFSS